MQIFLITEKAWHQKAELRPYFTEMILDRSTCETQLMIRFYLAHSFCLLGSRIFNCLRFIENQVVVFRIVVDSFIT